MNQMPEPVPVGTVAIVGPEGKPIVVPAVVWPVFRGVPAVVVIGSPQVWQTLERAGVTGKAPSPSPSEVPRASPINHDPITLRRTLVDPRAGEWARRPTGLVEFGCPRCGRLSLVRCPGQIIDEQGFVRPTFVCECGLHCGLQLGGFAYREDQCPTCGDDPHPFLPCTQLKEEGMCGCMHGLWEAPQEDGWPPAQETGA